MILYSVLSLITWMSVTESLSDTGDCQNVNQTWVLTLKIKIKKTAVLQRPKL